MEHLSLEIFDLKGTGSKYATLPEDTTINFTDTSEIFAGGDVWTQDFTLNIRANAHIFGTAGELHGARLHELINNRKARWWVEGLPLFLGYLVLSDEVEVDEDGNISVNFESGQKTFDEMIEGGMANQVPMMSDILIGMALWRKRACSYSVYMKAQALMSDGRKSAELDVTLSDNSKEIPCGDNGEYHVAQEYPRMVFPKGVFENTETNEEETIDCINTDYPYTENENGVPTHPYCNVALCYQKQDYPDNNTGIKDYTASPEPKREYEVMPANRINSAPNFYVLYWLRCLMNYLGIHIDENQMMDVEDLRRLFLVNTNCAHEVPDYLKTADESTPAFARLGRYYFSSYRYIAEYFEPANDQATAYKPFLNIDKDHCGIQVEDFNIISGPVIETEGNVTAQDLPSIQKINVRVTGYPNISSEVVDAYKSQNGYLHKAFATSECFPNVNISDVISAIKNGFGVRFLFSEDYKRVRIVLLRNIFRNTAVQKLDCDILEQTKVENNIRGFRMTYGAGTEDTHFYYKGFADKLPTKKEIWQDNSDKHDYLHWNLDAQYSNIIHQVSAFNKTCYVTTNTGNAYGVKVDKDAKLYDELHPSLFEFAAFMDAEDGDCSGESETIQEINVGFAPAIMNDINARNERDNGDTSLRYALFVDETMRPRRQDLDDGNDYNDPDANYDVDKLYSQSNAKSEGIVQPGLFAITSDREEAWIEDYLRTTVRYYHIGYDDKSYIATWNISFGAKGHISEGYRLYLQDNFEPNDDGVSPIETHDWGLTFGIMRGSGSDAYVDYSADTQDGEGNDTWEVVSGSSITAHPDTCDCYGNEWDYNGTSYVDGAASAIAELEEQFTDGNAPYYTVSNGYLTQARLIYVRDNEGNLHNVLVATSYSISGGTVSSMSLLRQYPAYLDGHTPEEIMAIDAAGVGPFHNLIIELDSSEERKSTLLQLCRMAYGGETGKIAIDNGIGSRYGRISLKLRAEKPNPYFDASQPENTTTNRRYLSITNKNLQGRGLMDQFYKEYSKFIREARIAKYTVPMELAQLLSIDKTVRIYIGDTLGFIRKMQYSVSNKTGLGMVTVELMYI